MPIKPENKARYPKDWKAIRASVLKRAEDKCEKCGVKNHAWRNNTIGIFTMDPMLAESWELVDRDSVTYIVLTIAHLDHTPENCSLDNLRAWCQKCHLAYDHKHHQRNAYETRRKGKAAKDIFA